MQSVAKFVTKAYPVSGCFDYLSEVRTEGVCARACARVTVALDPDRSPAWSRPSRVGAGSSETSWGSTGVAGTTCRPSRVASGQAFWREMGIPTSGEGWGSPSLCPAGHVPGLPRCGAARHAFSFHGSGSGSDTRRRGGGVSAVRTAEGGGAACQAPCLAGGCHGPLSPVTADPERRVTEKSSAQGLPFSVEPVFSTRG